MGSKKTQKPTANGSKQPPAVETAPVARPQMVQVFAVLPNVMKQTIDLLENELPMSKARQIVQSLENAPIVSIPPPNLNML